MTWRSIARHDMNHILIGANDHATEVLRFGRFQRDIHATMTMMILSLFNEGMRVRADTPR